MKDVKIYESIVNSGIKDKVKEAQWCTDLVQYATYKCKIDGLIASAYLFCPRIIQVKDYIFIEQFWNFDAEESLICIAKLEKQYQNNKKDIEMSVNTWSIGDFFIGDDGELMDNDEIIIQFANALVYFWENRVKSLFPDKKIVVRLGNNLMGELGICITMYEES